MNLLAIDTTTPHSSVALALKGKPQSFLTAVQMQQQAQGILPLIDQILAENGCSLPQLDGLVVGRGPGSFTGIRIAVSVAQGLAWTQDLPVYLVSSLQMMAYEAYLESNHWGILSLLDARMNQLYWAFYDNADDLSIEQVNSPQAIMINKPCLITGYNYLDYLPLLQANFSSYIQDTKITYPKASTMLQWVMEHDCPSVSADKVWPVYVRNQVV